MINLYYKAIRFALSPIKQCLRLAIFKSDWRTINKHNHTQVRNIFPKDKVIVGNGTYGELEVYSFGGKNEGLDIGSYCSIAGNVVFILGGEHKLDTISTYPFSRHVFKKNDTPGESTKGRITIDDDVWIGHGVIILSGVHISQGAVIGAGSVVTKDVPPYAVYVGNAVKKFRFSNDIIKELLKIDYKHLTHESYERFSEFVEDRVTSSNVFLFVKALSPSNDSVEISPE